MRRDLQAEEPARESVESTSMLLLARVLLRRSTGYNDDDMDPWSGRRRDSGKDTAPEWPMFPAIAADKPRWTECRPTKGRRGGRRSTPTAISARRNANN